MGDVCEQSMRPVMVAIMFYFRCVGKSMKLLFGFVFPNSVKTDRKVEGIDSV